MGSAWVMELVLLLGGRFSSKSRISHQACEGTLHGKKTQKLEEGFKAQNALEKEIVSHICLLINFHERLSPALNP